MPNGAAFSPVVRIHVDERTGTQWFVHRDGSRSTTQMVEQEAGGRRFTAPGWVVAGPPRAGAQLDPVSDPNGTNQNPPPHRR
jgi:hypothetical protein